MPKGNFTKPLAAFTFLLAVLGWVPASWAATLGGNLNLADEGVFFVGGRSAVSRFPGVSPAGPVPPGTVVVDQMYVHYRIPANLTSPTPIVLVHGGGLTGASYETTPDGREGWATYFARKGYARPSLVRAIVNIEGAQAIVPTDAQIAAYKGLPVLELFGDYLDSPVFTGRPRYEARKSVVQRINRNEGGRATLVSLPEVGIKGNSHMMMQDKNNLQVADFILSWIAQAQK